MKSIRLIGFVEASKMAWAFGEKLKQTGSVEKKEETQSLRGLKERSLNRHRYNDSASILSITCVISAKLLNQHVENNYPLMSEVWAIGPHQ